MLKRGDVKYIKAMYALGPFGVGMGVGALVALFYEPQVQNPLIFVMVLACIGCLIGVWFLGGFMHRRWSETHMEVLRDRLRD